MKKLSICMCLFALAAACGDDEPSNLNNTNNQVDMGSDTRADPDTRVVEPPPPPAPVPKFLTVDITPGRSLYRTGLSVVPEVVVYDVLGEVIQGAGVEIKIEPDGAAERTDGRWLLVDQGWVEFVACAVLPGLDGAQVCDRDRIFVDDAPPTLTIIRPTPGAQFDATADPMILVEGRVEDSNGEPRVFVGGREVPVVDGTFAAEIAPRFGINHIAVSAIDGVNPATTKMGVDVLWAQSYEAVSESRPEYVDPQALTFRLGQNFVDDGQKTAREPDGTFVTRDLADILELVLLYIDFMNQLTNPIVDSPSFSLSIASITPGKPRIEIDITDEGMELFIQIDDMIVATTGGFDLDGQVVSLDGSIDAKFSALANLTIRKATAADPVSVQLSGLALSVDEATPNFVAPEANAIFTLAQSALRTTIEDLLRTAVEDAFVAQLPALISDLLTSLDTSLRGQSLNLDLGLGTPLALELDIGMDRIRTTYRSALDADMTGMCFVDSPIVGPASRGVGIDPTDDGTVPLYDSSRIQIAIRGAFGNGLLHTIWAAGALEIDAKDQLPVSVDRADLSAKLPPVIRGPKEGLDGGLVVQLGQVELDVELLGSREVYGVFIEAGLTLTLAGNALTVSVSDEPTIYTWRISQSGERAVLSPEVLQGLVLSSVYPQLVSAVSQGLSLELPPVGLSDLGGIAPQLSNLVLSFEQVRPVDYRNGYIVVDAGLEGRL